jgi:hypothetical protein
LGGPGIISGWKRSSSEFACIGTGDQQLTTLINQRDETIGRFGGVKGVPWALTSRTLLSVVRRTSVPGCCT